MANANGNSNGNSNGKNNGNGKVTKIQKIVQDGKAGMGRVMEIVSLVGGNRPANDEVNRLSLHADGTYVTLLTPASGLPQGDSEIVTRYMLEKDGKEGVTFDSVRAHGVEVPWTTESGNTELFLVAEDAPEVIRGGEGALPPVSSYTEIAPAPETADEPAQDSVQAAPEAQDGSGPGKIYLGGKVYRQNVVDFNVKSMGVAVTGKVAEGATVPFIRLGYFCHTGLVNFVIMHNEDGKTVLSDVEADEINVLPVGAEFVDGFFARGDFTVASEPVDEDGAVSVGLQSSLYPGRTFTLKTPGGAGQFARSYALGSDVGDNIHVVDSVFDPATGYLTDAKAANTTKRDAKRAAKAAQAA